MTEITSSALRAAITMITVGPMARVPVVVIESWRTLMTDLFNPYRPEQHYMRGPGPRWRERYARIDASGSSPG